MNNFTHAFNLEIIVKTTTIITVLICFSTVSADKPNDWMHFYLNGLEGDWLSGGVVEDCTGNIWTGGASLTSVGIAHLSNEAIVNCEPKLVVKRNPTSDIQDVLTHSNGDVWFFSRDSFYIYNSAKSDSLIYMSDYNGQDLIEVRAIENNAGDIYLGSRRSAFIIRYSSKQIVPFDIPDTSYSMKPDYLDSNGDVWFVGDGIFKYDGNEWRHYTKDNSGIESNFYHNEGRKVVEDRDGNIIVATWDKGLFIFDGNDWGPYAQPLPGGFTNISNIAVDSSGKLWADFDYYIGYYTEENWNIYNENDYTSYRAPLNHSMSEIMVDHKNRVWFAGRHCGLFMLNQSQENSCRQRKKLEIIIPNETTVWDTDEINRIEWKSWGYIYSVNLRYEVNENDEWIPIKSNDRPVESSFLTSWRTPTITSHRYRLRIFSIDDSTIADTTEFFTIRANGQNLPPILQNIPDSLEAKSEETTTWTAQATDPEGDPVTFTFTDLPSWATVSQSTLTLDPTRNDSSATVRVIAADNNGGADTADLYIVVSHATTTEWGVGTTGPSANMLHVGKKKINLPAGKIKRVTLFNVQGKMIATVDTKNEYANLLRITKNITDSFVVAKIQYGDKTSIQRTICLME